MISGITLYNIHYSKFYCWNRFGTDILIQIQLALAYMPLVCFTAYAIYIAIGKAKDCYVKLNVARNTELQEFMNSESEDEFPSRLEDMETDESAGTNKLSSLSY